MKTKDLLDKIEKLEARIRDLEARPVYPIIHVHPSPAPVYVPVVPYYVQPYIQPSYPWYTPMCGGAGNNTQISYGGNAGIGGTIS